MRRVISVALLALMSISLLASAQTPAAGAAGAPASQSEAFEEASIRVAVVGPRGGSGPLGHPCNGAGPRVDPGRFSVGFISVYRLISWAYAKACPFNGPEQIYGGPSWIRTETYAVEALIPAGSPSYTIQNFLRGEAPKLQKMLQTLLAERFKLTVRTEKKETPIYDLVPGKATGRMKLSDDQSPPDLVKEGEPRRATFSFSTDRVTNVMTLSAKAVSLQTLLDAWLPLVDRPVVNKAGMTGVYDIAPFQFTLETAEGSRSQVAQIFEQLGLKLEPAKGPVESIIIERVEKPTEN
jgi:uncharacterized protein (TIGR03435 family)